MFYTATSSVRIHFQLLDFIYGRMHYLVHVELYLFIIPARQLIMPSKHSFTTSCSTEIYPLTLQCQHDMTKRICGYLFTIEAYVRVISCLVYACRVYGHGKDKGYKQI